MPAIRQSKEEVERRPCYMTLSLALENVILKDQIFIVTGNVECFWQDPELNDVEEIGQANGPLPWQDISHNATFEKLLSEPVHKFIINEDGDRIIKGNYQFLNNCSENFELDLFPFDRQVLNMRTTFNTIMFEFLAEKPDWVPDVHCLNRNKSDQILRTKLGDKLAGMYEMFPPVVDFDSDEEGCILLRLLVERKVPYYWNLIVMPTALMLIGTVPVVSIEVAESADRLMHIGAMFLVAIVSQLNFSQILPAGCEFTLMDAYLLFSLFMVGCCLIENALILVWFDESDDNAFATKIDQIYYSAFAGIIFLVHGVMWYMDAVDYLRMDWREAMAEDSAGAEEWFPELEEPGIVGALLDDEYIFKVIGNEKIKVQ